MGNIDNIRFYNRGDVRWYEFSLINSLDTTFESIQIEVNYGKEIRLLKDNSWRGRKGISHREYATEYASERKITFNLPPIEPNEREEFWIAFVSLKKGTYSFNSRINLQNDSGEWMDAKILLTELSAARAIEIDKKTEEEPIEMLEVTAEDVDTELTAIKSEYPKINFLRKYSITLLISVIINIFLIVVLIALIFCTLVHKKKNVNKQTIKLNADFGQNHIARDAITIGDGSCIDFGIQAERDQNNHKFNFGSTKYNKLIELIMDNELLKNRINNLEKESSKKQQHI